MPASVDQSGPKFCRERPDRRFGFRLKNVSARNLPFTHIGQSRPRCVICRSPNVSAGSIPASDHRGGVSISKCKVACPWQSVSLSSMTILPSAAFSKRPSSASASRPRPTIPASKPSRFWKARTASRSASCCSISSCPASTAWPCSSALKGMLRASAGHRADRPRLDRHRDQRHARRRRRFRRQAGVARTARGLDPERAEDRSARRARSLASRRRSRAR